MTEIISVRFRNGGKQYYFDPRGVQVPLGAAGIIETARGPEYGHCVQSNALVEDDQVVQPLRPLLRLATEEDERTLEKNQEKEKRAFQICLEKIAAHKLEMKLVRVEYNFDSSNDASFPNTDGQVDFRALVRDLAGVFHTHIELRQIGVRDEAKMLGGLGICGRPLCCGSFLGEFQPVSIKMAKTQNLSLNPTKISGTCGRLMCCLKYEQEAYEDAVRRMPKNDSFVETPDGVGDVCQVDLLKERVKVRLDSAPETPKCYRNCEICVVRNGKGKRPEDYVPPAPEELAKRRWVDPEARTAPRPARERSALEEALERVFQAADEEAAPLREKKNAEHSRGRSGSARRKKPEGAAAPQEGKKGGQQPPRQKQQRQGGQQKPRPEQASRPPRQPQEKEPRQQQAAPAAAPQQGDRPPRKPGGRGRPHRRRPGGKPPQGGQQQPPKGE